MQVTSKTGKQINIEINATGSEIIATAGNLSFGAEQTERGFKTRFPELIGGKKTHIHVEFESAELDKVKAIFAQLHASIRRDLDAVADYQRQYDGVRKMMAE